MFAALPNHGLESVMPKCRYLKVARQLNKYLIVSTAVVLRG